ncbi:hypothetical protein [Spirosoma luteum]|nr:hypothetical protein [Spirosoma luteum]
MAFALFDPALLGANVAISPSALLTKNRRIQDGTAYQLPCWLLATAR